MIDNLASLSNVNGSKLFEGVFHGFTLHPNVKRGSLMLFNTDFCITNTYEFENELTLNGTTHVHRFVHKDGSADPKDLESCHRDIPYRIDELGESRAHMSSFVEIEPYTGWIMKSGFRKQINSKIPAVADVRDSNITLPVFYYEEVAEAGQEVMQHLDDFVFYKIRLIISVGGYFILAGVLMLFILLFAYFRTRRAGASLQHTQQNTELAPEAIFKL